MKKLQTIKIHQAAGFTIFELLIALSLGIILLLGLASIYTVAQQSDGQNRALNANNEIARQVFRILDHSFQQAGYVDPLDSPSKAFSTTNSLCKLTSDERYGSIIADVANSNIENIYRRYNDPARVLSDSMLTAIGRVSCGGMVPILGCGSENGFKTPPDIFSGSLSECDDKNATDTKQAIEIAFQALAAGEHGLSNLNNIASGSSAVDCTGTNVTKDQNGFVVNQFFIEDDHGENSLTCQSNLQDTDIALVQGIEEMTFRYITTIQEKDADIRIGESDSGRVLAAYKTAAQLYDDEKKDPANLDWATVVGVEVCLVVSAPNRANNGLTDLGKTQGDNRPTCARDATGSYIANVAKDEDKKDRYYQRYERIFKIPNTLFLSH